MADAISPKNAAATVKLLPQPVGMQKRTWLGVQRMLRVVCHYWPNPYPSIPTIAAKLGEPVSTVHRWIQMAEAEGLIKRIPRGDGYRSGMTYELLFLSRFLSHSGNEKRVKVPPLLQGEESERFGGAARRRNLYEQTCPWCLRKVPERRGWLLRSPEGQHGAIHERCDRQAKMTGKFREDDPNTWGPAYGEDPEGPQPKGVSLRRDPAVALARAFQGGWNHRVLVQRPELRGLVEWGEVGPAVTYIRSQMLDHLSFDHIEAFFDSFLSTAVDDAVDFKEGQTAWSRFTGWWKHNPVEDPTLRRAAQAEGDAIIAAYRKMRQEG